MTGKIRLDEDIYGVTDLRDSLQQVIDKAVKTKRPMVITKRGRPVAAIVDVRELQRLYDALEAQEQDEDRKAIEEFEAAEARGEVSWLSDDEMSAWLGDLLAKERKHA